MKYEMKSAGPFTKNQIVLITLLTENHNDIKSKPVNLYFEHFISISSKSPANGFCFL